MSDATVSFVVLGVLVALFVVNRLPVELVAFGGTLALYAAGVLDLQQAFAGFSDPTVLFIAALFVVSEGLEATGVTTWAGQALMAWAGRDRGRLVAATLLLVAGAAALITVTGAVAALLPVAVVVAVRMATAPSKLLMPVAFVAGAGSMLALTGTPVNVIVSEAAQHAGVGAFGFFAFALVGVPLVAGTIAICLVLGPRLLPERSARVIPTDLSLHADVLADHYQLDAPAGAPALFTRERGVAEVVVAPRSGLIGERVFPGMLTGSGDLMVLAVQRRGEPRGPTATALAAGDTLLLRGTWSALDENLADPDVLVVDAPGLVRRQTVPLGHGARGAIAILAAMVALLAGGVVAPAIATLLAAGAMVATGIVPIPRAYRAISWTTVVLIAAMIPVSTAIEVSGAAQQIADAVVDGVGDAGPHVLLIVLFAVTAVFGQLISNTATALIVIPVAVSAAADLGVSARPVLMSVAVAAAASFLTPIATPANLMVMGPGGYRFGDYWRLGLPVMALFFAVAVGLVPLIWSF
ncbi:MAG: di-/tricarboxylate transporter [Conexibacter sp.]|nr:di-/tricarboxylate transporter [Conexibacter sp.]